MVVGDNYFVVGCGNVFSNGKEYSYTISGC